MGVVPPLFVDKDGSLFPQHIQKVLQALWPRLRRTFPALQDEALLADLMEEAGRRLVEAERRIGAIEGIYGYAWVTIRSVALSRLRRDAAARQAARGYGQRVEAAGHGSPERVERELLYQEVLATLTKDERRLVLWKRAGFSSAEIARRLGTSPQSVDMQFFRIRAKIARHIQRAPDEMLDET